MKIGIDVRMIFSFPTGIGNYRTSLIEALFKIDNKNEYVLIGNDSQKTQFEKFLKLPNVSFASIKSKANHPIQHFFLPFELAKLKLDIFYTTPWGATLGIPCKYVLEIPDLIYHHYPQFGSWKSRLYEMFLEKVLANKADHIVTISDFVKNDIHKFLGVDLDKITNMKGAVGKEYRIIEEGDLTHSVMKKYDLNIDPDGNVFFAYFIYLGNQRPHKNLVKLLKAFENFHNESIKGDVFLVIVGGVDASGRSADSEKIQTQLSSMKNKECVKLLGKVYDNNEVAALFNEALAMVHPSLHEGFGMTPLEAMNCGCPVISSNVASMPEVIGDAGILIDPNDEKQISDAMTNVYYDVNLRKELKEKSIERAKLFSWEKTANILLKTFEKLN